MMKKIIYLNFLMLFLLSSCGNTKQIQNYIYSGDYDTAINLSVEKLKKKKGSKSGDAYALLLKEAYDKANQKDLETINKLKANTNPNKWQKIYDTYLNLDNRQEDIKPLLPIYVVKENRQLDFPITDYTSKILDAKDHLVSHLYKKANILLGHHNKKDAREAYDLLDEIDRIDPDYKNTRSLMNQAHQAGMSHALVIVENKTNQVIPRRLSDELLNFSSYGANNFWVDYHNQRISGVNYDHQIKLKFTQILIGPNQSRDKEIVEEKTIQDGYDYLKDGNGNVVKDSLGHPIKRPRYIKVRSNVHLYQQYKETALKAVAEIIDLRTNQRVDNFPLESKFIFDHKFATYRGDKRAIRNEILNFLKEKQVRFPTTEQMIYDASKQIKMQFKDILNQATFL